MTEPSAVAPKSNTAKRQIWFFIIGAPLAGCILLALILFPSVNKETGDCPEPKPVALTPPGRFHASPFDTPYAWSAPGDAWAHLGRGRAYTVKFSPDGILLVVGSAIGIEAFDTNTLDRSWYISTEHGIGYLSFSTDGMYLVSHEYQGITKGMVVREVLTGQQSAALELEELKCDVTSPIWSPDSQRIAFGMGKKVYSWNPHTSQLEVSSQTATEVTSVTWSPDGKLIATGLKDGITIVSDLDTGQTVNKLEPTKTSTAVGHDPALFKRSLLGYFSSEVSGVAFSQDGRYLVTTITITRGSDPIAHELVWDLHTGETVSSPDIDDVWLSTFTTPIAVSRNYKELAVWDTERKEVILTLSDKNRYIADYAWTGHDGGKVAAIAEANEGERIVLWNLAAPSNPQYIDGYGSGYDRLAWRSENILVSTMNYDNIVSWDMDTGELQLEWKYKENLEDQLLTKDLSRYVTLGHCDSIALHDGETGKVISSLAIDHVDCREVVTNSTGTQIVLLDSEQVATVVDLTIPNSWSFTGISSETYYGYWDRIALSPDGTVLAFALDDWSISVWDTRTGRLLNTLPGNDEIGGLYFNESSTTLASLTEQSSRSVPIIQLWNIHTGQKIQTLVGHDYTRVEAIAFDPTNTRIAGVGDEEVYLWDMRSGDLLDVLSSGGYSLSTLSWSPDGKMLATSYWFDGGILIWKIDQ